MKEINMKKRKTFEIKQTAKWLLCLVLTGFALASCNNENDESGVVIEIPTMDDPITDVSAWIFNADNTLKHYYDFSKLEDKIGRASCRERVYVLV